MRRPLLALSSAFALGILAADLFDPPALAGWLVAGVATASAAILALLKTGGPLRFLPWLLALLALGVARGNLPEPPAPPRLLTLTIHRSTDANRDRRRLRRLHGILTQYPGHDRFRFLLVDDVKTAKLDFPNHPIGINDEILDYIARTLGEDNITIDPL